MLASIKKGESIRRAFRKSFSMFAAAVISFVAVSCSLFGDEEPSAERNFVEPALTASVNGSVALSGAVPGALRSSAARTALPSLGEEISYSVEAASGGERPYVAEVDGENLTFSFGDLAVSEGGTEYTITASGKIGDETVLFGKVTETLRPGDAFFCEVPVKPYMKSGTGSVSLEIDVSETEIKSCAVTISGEDCVIPPPRIFRRENNMERGTRFGMLRCGFQLLQHGGFIIRGWCSPLRIPRVSPRLQIACDRFVVRLVGVHCGREMQDKKSSRR